jgi:hypothetical protein
MSGRKNTIVCFFDHHNPRTSAFEIHEWIHDTMRLHEDEVAMIHIDGGKRQVFVKFHDYKRMSDILESTQGEGEFRHNNGEMSVVRIEAGGLGMKRVRLTNIPPEGPDSVLKTALERYGQVKEIHAETWSQAYSCPVENGIRVAMVTLVANIPSHLLLTGHRSLVFYESQPPKYYGCNDTGHVYIECPKRKKVKGVRRGGSSTALAELTAMRRIQVVENQAGSSVGLVEPERRSVEMGPAEGSRRDVDSMEEIVIVHYESKDESNMGIMHQWADDASDIVTPEHSSVDPPQELTNSDMEWPALRQHDDILHDTNMVTTYQDTIHKE